MFLSCYPVRVSRVRLQSLCSAALGCFLLLPGSAVVSAQAPATVQTATNGTVRGLVTDPDGAIVPGATVMLTPAKGNGISAKSGSDGTFRLQVPAGTYTMSVSLEGFATYNRPGVKLAAGQSLTVDAKLIVGDTTTVVNVVSDAAMVSVDPDAAASSTVIKGKDLEALSDDPDELSAELSALAGPAAGPNGGQIYVDGFTGGQLPPKSSIREIRINQNPFSAEYDKLGYGRVEVFTKPGTDKFHGMLSTQGSLRQLNTSNPFLGSSDTQPDYHTFFLLGSLTGPLTKSSSFSIGGSRRDISENAIVNPTAIYSTGPTSTTLCPPGSSIATCNSYAFPTNARAVLQPQLRSDISPRVDLALGPKNVLTARYQFESGSQTNAGIGTNTLPTAGSKTGNNEHTIQISDTQTVSSKMVNETRFEYQREESSSVPNSTAAAISVQGTFTGGGNSTQNSDTVLTHIEVQNYTSVALSQHFLRFGGRLRTNGEDITSNSGSNGSFVYTNLLDPCTDPSVTNKPSGCGAVPVKCGAAQGTGAGANYVSSYECGTPSQFRATTILRGTVHARQTDVGLYAEDDWKYRPNLTFSYGIRFEAQNVIHASHNFAPRLSISYGVPRAGGKPSVTVVRGGFGMFYDRFSLDNIATYNQLLAGSPAQQQVTVQNPGAGCSPTNLAGCPLGTAGRISQYTLAPDLRSSYTMLGAIGVDQQLGRIGTISVNYLASRGNHEFLTRVTPTATAYNYQYQSSGVFREQQLFVNANIRTQKVQMFGFYAMSFANANTSSANFIPTSTDPRVDYGRAAFATRSYAVMGGTYNAPYKVNLSPFLIVRSGQPYNITTGTDVNNDSVYNDRPAYNPSAALNCRSAASFTTPAQGSAYSEIPINSCVGPSNFSVNLRLARTIGFGPRTDAANGGGNGRGNRGGGGGGPMGGGRGGPGGGGPGGGGPGGGGRGGFGGGNSGQRYNLTLGVQAQNVFNVVPYSTPVSVLSNTRFGTFTNIASRPFSSGNAVRSITLQATFNF